MDVVELEPEVVEVKHHVDAPSNDSTKTQNESYRDKRIGPCSADMFNLLWLGSCLFVVILTFLAAQVTRSFIRYQSISISNLTFTECAKSDQRILWIYWTWFALFKLRFCRAFRIICNRKIH